MRASVIMIITLLILGSQFRAYGGPSTSGGGVGVLCKKNSSETLTLLDLYEPSLSGQALAQPTGNALTDYVTGWNHLLSLQPGQRPLDSKQINEIKKWMTKINFVRQIWPTNDYGLKPKLPPECEYRQIALYNDSDNTLSVERNLWSKLDSLSKAALFMHEVLYRQMRTSYFMDSVWVRKLVREVFSKNGPLLKGSHADLAPGRGIECWAGDDPTKTRFVWQEKKIHLLQIFGSPIWIQTTVDVPVSSENIQLKEVFLDPNQVPEPIPSPVPGTYNGETGYVLLDTNQDFELSGERLISQIQLPQISWRQEIKKSQIFRVGFNVAGRTLIYPVSNCSQYSGF